MYHYIESEDQALAVTTRSQRRTQEEDVSRTREEDVSGTQEEDISGTQEEDVSGTQEENVSWTQKEDIRGTQEKDHSDLNIGLEFSFGDEIFKKPKEQRAHLTREGRWRHCQNWTRTSYSTSAIQLKKEQEGRAEVEKTGRTGAD